MRNGLGVSFLLVTSVYLFPVLVCTGVLPNHQWATGSFATAATQIGGRWLGHWVVLASGISLLAQFFAGVSGESMQLQGIAERQQLPSAFGRQSPYHTPTVSSHFVSHGQAFFPCHRDSPACHYLPVWAAGLSSNDVRIASSSIRGVGRIVEFRLLPQRRRRIYGIRSAENSSWR